MKDENVNKYITVFAKLARKALYHEDDPTVLEKFKSGLPLELLEPCMNHDDPRNWEAWTRSARTHQAILTSLKAHQTDVTQRSPSPMKVCTPTPPSTPPPICYDLFPFLLIYLLFCLSLCAAPCLALFAFLCACLVAYLCVVLNHILHDT